MTVTASLELDPRARERHEAPGVLAQHRGVEPAQDVGGGAVAHDRGADRVARQRGDRGGLGALAADVADDREPLALGRSGTGRRSRRRPRCPRPPAGTARRSPGPGSPAARAAAATAGACARSPSRWRYRRAFSTALPSRSASSPAVAGSTLAAEPAARRSCSGELERRLAARRRGRARARRARSRTRRRSAARRAARPPAACCSTCSEPASTREVSDRKRCASSACLISVMSSTTLIASRGPAPSSTGLAFTRDQRCACLTTSGSGCSPSNTWRPGSSVGATPSAAPRLSRAVEQARRGAR